MSRYARRKDNNQNEIVEQAEAHGYAVIDLSPIGNGIPDLILSDSTDMWPVEVKTKYGKLTPNQEDFHRKWRGKPILVVHSFSELMEKIKTS